nr:FOG-1S [Caenorhabditis japonica]AAT72441.1 FOG-1S [Caenorhabditis japonica]
MNRETINSFFAQFGSVFVDWPVKGPRTNIRGKPIPMSSYSYLFLVYYEEKSVLKLMEACQSPVENEFYVCVPGYIESRIQIRPWFIRNAFYVSKKAMHARVIDIHRTVFVGGLPRIVTASEISQMFSEFGKVLLVTIDIDQDYGYPKGAARVTFERDWSFNKALEKRYLKFDNIDSSKTTIEIKPYVMEDVGCDQCGGLWFNPFLDVYDQLKSCLKTQEKPKSPSFSLENMWTPTSDELGVFDMWKSFHPKDSEHCDAERDEPEERQFLGGYETDKNEIRAGACKFVEMAKKFGLDNEQKVNVGGTDYPIGPDLWYHFVPPPYYEASYEPIKLRVDQQIESHLHLKRVNVCSNKSSYCKEAPCRQYYCPSCSNKLHSGPNQHILMPAGKPERRPRKDKNMYLVTQKS